MKCATQRTMSSVTADGNIIEYKARRAVTGNQKPPTIRNPLIRNPQFQ